MKNLILFLSLALTVHTYATDPVRIAHHKLQPKESLFRISLLYNSTVPDIIKANPDLDLNKLRAGMTIKVPKDTKVRDAEDVISLLNNGPIPYNTAVAAKSEPAKVEPAQKKELTVAARVVTKEATFAAAKEKTTEKAAITPVAIEKPTPVNNAEDENPFITPAKNKVSSNQKSEFDNLAVNTTAPIVVPREEKTLINDYSATAPKTETKANEVKETKQVIKDAHGGIYESDIMQIRYTELRKQSSGNPDVQVIDLGQLRLNSNKYKDQVASLNQNINNNQILLINLQIIMKDGSVKTIVSPQEQKKILAQIVGTVASN